MRNEGAERRKKDTVEICYSGGDEGCSIESMPKARDSTQWFCRSPSEAATLVPTRCHSDAPHHPRYENFIYFKKMERESKKRSISTLDFSMPTAIKDIKSEMAQLGAIASFQTVSKSIKTHFLPLYASS